MLDPTELAVQVVAGATGLTTDQVRASRTAIVPAIAEAIRADRAERAATGRREDVVSHISSRARALRNQAQQLERDTFARIVAMEAARAWEEMAAELRAPGAAAEARHG